MTSLRKEKPAGPKAVYQTVDTYMANFIARRCGFKGREGMNQAKYVWNMTRDLAARMKRHDIEGKGREPSLSKKDLDDLRSLGINRKFVEELADRSTVLARATREKSGRINIEIGTQLLGEENTNESPPLIPIYARTRNGDIQKDKNGRPKVLRMQPLTLSYYSSCSSITRYMYNQPRAEFKGMKPSRII